MLAAVWNLVLVLRVGGFFFNHRTRRDGEEMNQNE